jgi:hypothetical protein
MEPIEFNDLPDWALLLIDSSPIIYVLEGKAKFGPRLKLADAVQAASALAINAAVLVGSPTIEALYRTHWISPKLSEKKRERLAEKASRTPELVSDLEAQQGE